MVLKGQHSHGFAAGEGSEWLSKLVTMPWPFTCIRQSYWFSHRGSCCVQWDGLCDKNLEDSWDSFCNIREWWRENKVHWEKKEFKVMVHLFMQNKKVLFNHKKQQGYREPAVSTETVISFVDWAFSWTLKWMKYSNCKNLYQAPGTPWVHLF